MDWHEEHKLLKAAFPVDIRSAKAVYEIPFGSIERPTHTNTSWEQAQFEVCGHRWADLSEGGYGVSLLNDCKYGYDIKGSVLRLSLLRSPRWPDNTADIGVHEFTYSLYPHEGGWRESEVVRQGFELNQPLTLFATTAHEGVRPSTASLLEVQSRHGIVDAIKIAEDSGGAVIRLYESGGGRERMELAFSGGPEGRKEASGEAPAYGAGGSPVRVTETNLMEQPEENPQLSVIGGTVTRTLTPYEVVTIKAAIH